jgi:hypothetical protein
MNITVIIPKSSNASLSSSSSSSSMHIYTSTFFDVYLLRGLPSSRPTFFEAYLLRGLSSKLSSYRGDFAVKDFEDFEAEAGAGEGEGEAGDVKLLADFPTADPILPVKVDAPATFERSAVKSLPLALFAP